MSKWYEAETKEQDVIVGSRIRLRRNIRDVVFPQTMSEPQRAQYSEEFGACAKTVAEKNAVTISPMELGQCRETLLQGLRERNILGKSALSEPKGTKLLLSEDESVSILVNSDDHIQLQVSREGLHLRELLSFANKMDDGINEIYPFAFDEKYGYMTCFPTNLGTGLRAYLIMHLPVLASSQRFRTITAELGRYGVAIRDALTTEDKNPSGLYVIYNQKTLGVSEEDILRLLTKIGMQLAGSERKLRTLRAQKNPMAYLDEIYRAYGILKYARIMKYEDALLALSRLRIALTAERISFREPCSLYALMLETAPNNLKLFYQREASEEELDILRASYLREHLPELIEE